MNCDKRKFSTKFKLSVVKFAETSNNSASGRQFGVSEKFVREWRKSIEKLKAMPSKKYDFLSGRRLRKA